MEKYSEKIKFHMSNSMVVTLPMSFFYFLEFWDIENNKNYNVVVRVFAITSVILSLCFTIHIVYKKWKIKLSFYRLQNCFVWKISYIKNLLSRRSFFVSTRRKIHRDEPELFCLMVLMLDFSILFCGLFFVETIRALEIFSIVFLLKTTVNWSARKSFKCWAVVVEFFYRQDLANDLISHDSLEYYYFCNV